MGVLGLVYPSLEWVLGDYKATVFFTGRIVIDGPFDYRCVRWPPSRAAPPATLPPVCPRPDGLPVTMTTCLLYQLCP
ncbi:hypothetical protein J6590_032569 [Homalodisca vitripennis]|nr:hypothetical protein J6590_032569 [Homalodisca vitripennis]